MADGRGRKWQRLSGSKYKKLRLGRESSAAKQKDAILKFIQRLGSDEAEAHNNQSDDSTSNYENQNLAIEATFGKEKASGCEGNIVQHSNDRHAVGVDESPAVVVKDNDVNDMIDINYTDPSNWPVIND